MSAYRRELHVRALAMDAILSQPLTCSPRHGDADVAMFVRAIEDYLRVLLSCTSRHFAESVERGLAGAAMNVGRSTLPALHSTTKAKRCSIPCLECNTSLAEIDETT